MARKLPQTFDTGIKLNKFNLDPAYNEKFEGLIYNDNDTNIKTQLDGSVREIVTNTQVQTLSNKTFESPSINSALSSDGVFNSPTINSASINSAILSDSVFDVDDNLLSNIEVDNFKDGVIDVDLSNVSESDDTIPSAKATVSYANSVGSTAQTNLNNHLNDTTDAHDASAISSVASGNLVATDVQSALNELQSDIDTRALNSDLSNHLNDTTDAHAASAITNTPSGNLVATTIQAAVNELQSDIDTRATSTELSNHLNDTTDAHAASAIGNTPSGNLAATTVQAAVNELQGDIDTINNQKGAANGICPLGADSKVPSGNLPSYVDDVIEAANFAALPVTGEASKIYVTLDDNLTYRWSGSAYTEISKSLALGTTSSTAFRGDYGNTAYSHSQATTNVHGHAELVGTTAYQTIVNKHIDGGDASTDSRIVLPKETLANLSAITHKEASVVYGTDTKKVYYDDGSTLTPIGSGGAGSPAIYTTLKSDEDSGTWLTGDSSTFLGGGTLSGSFDKQNATNPLNGTYSYVYTQAAGSQDDYLASPLQPVPLRARGNTNRCKLVYTYDGNDNDIKAVIYDATNSAILSSQTAYIKTSSVGKQFEILFDVPATCVNLRVGFHVMAANSGKVLKFDDIQVSDEAFNVANLVTQESVTYTGYTSKDASNYIKLNGRSGKSDNVVLITDTNTTFTKFTINKTVKYSASANVNYTTTAPNNAILRHYDKDNNIRQSSSFYTGLNVSNAPLTLVGLADAGDYFVLITDASSLVTGAGTNFSITATAVSENIIQSWQDGTEWKALTYTEVNALPGNQGFGTFTAGGVEWKRDGGDLLYRGKLTLGTVTSSEARLPLPAGLLTSSVYSGIEVCGTAIRNAFAATVFGIAPLSEPSVGYITFGKQASTVSALAKAAGDNFGTGELLTFNVRVPIQGWSSAPTYLALPTSKDNNKTYTQAHAAITCTGLSATNYAKYYPYRTISKATGAPVWRLSFELNFTLSSGTTSVTDISIAGVSFDSGATTQQPLYAISNASNIGRAYTNGTSSTITAQGGASTTQFIVGGDIELLAKPTWADEWNEPGVFVGNVSPIAPTIQKFTSGSGTYTLPTTNGFKPTYIRVRMVGGGSGGAGSGTGTSGGTSGVGGTTSFGASLLTATGGSAVLSYVTGTGGTATINAPAFGSGFTGGIGSSMVYMKSDTAGGTGASSPFGGAGAGGAPDTDGKAAAANTGSGGGGGSSNSIVLSSGGGGCAGGYIDAIIPNPSSTYSYSVGAGGTAGAAGVNGKAGGAGGSGYIEVTEYYF